MAPLTTDPLDAAPGPEGASAGASSYRENDVDNVRGADAILEERSPGARSEGRGMMRDAVLFVPGLGLTDQSLNNVGQRLAVEFGRNAQTPSATFEVHAKGSRLPGAPLGPADPPPSDASTDPGGLVVYTITRRDGPNYTGAIDLYRLDYFRTLRGEFEQQSLFHQSLSLFVSILSNIPRLAGIFTHRAKGPNDKFQFLFAIGILLLLSSYMVILLVAVLQTIMQIPQFAGTTHMITLTTPQFLVVFISFAEVFWPNLKQQVRSAAGTYLSIINYFSVGIGREVIAGQFVDMIKYLVSQNRYRRIHVLAYSFGTLLAMDNLFSVGASALPPSTCIDSLVTIGCPFDLVRMLWRHYYADRHAQPNQPARWLNVYSPRDVLASNFRNDDELGPATEAIGMRDVEGEVEGVVLRPENQIYSLGGAQQDLNIFDQISLAGLRVHDSYWASGADVEISCFNQVVKSLYDGDRMLA